MSERSSIEWTDATWNPIRGCTKVSPGCKHCYAETFAERWRGVPGHPYEQGFDLRLVPEKLVEPLLWVKSRTIFVNSMSDLFQEEVPEEYVGRVIAVMELADWHIYQVLTKRGARMRELITRKHRRIENCRNIWMGVSVEKVDEGGEFSFSDATDPKQLVLFTKAPNFEALEKSICGRFAGKTASVEEIEGFVLADTPFRETHYKTQVLRRLEKRDPPRITALSSNPKRKPGTFADPKMFVSFEDTL